MNKTFAALAVSIALVSFGATAVTAADMNGNGHGSIKDRAGGTPVPAPVPYEEHYKYYIGAGLGWTMRASGDIGLTAGGYNGNLPFGDADDMRGPFGVSLFAGRYITPSIRAELGLDMRHAQKRSRRIDYTATLTNEHDFGAGPVTNTNTYTMQRDEDFRQRNHTAMLNLYYDMNRGGRFNPYIGAGIGVSYMHFNRTSQETIVSCAGTPDPAVVPVPPAPHPCQAGVPPIPTTGATSGSFSDGQSGWGIAAALMAGMTYNMTERTHLDVGYRMIYQGGKAVISSSSLGPCAAGCPFSGTSIMNVGARVDHELRAGIRWDLW